MVDLLDQDCQKSVNLEDICMESEGSRLKFKRSHGILIYQIYNALAIDTLFSKMPSVATSVTLDQGGVTEQYDKSYGHPVKIRLVHMTHNTPPVRVHRESSSHCPRYESNR